MSKFYSSSGDDGTTGLLNDKRVDKCDLQIEVLGSLDELSAMIGLARSLCNLKINEDLKKIQAHISALMADVASSGGDQEQRFAFNAEEARALIEGLIEEYSASVKMPRQFILPGDNPESAALSVARTTARRAERRLVEFSRKKSDTKGSALKYLNRLSSFLYLLEIYTLQNQASSSRG